MQSHKIFILFFIILAIFDSCKPKKDPEPQIPCEQLADFRVYSIEEYQKFEINNNTWYPTEVEGDTFMMAQGISDHRVYFEAKYEGADKYEWWIGNETTPRVGKKISVLFLVQNLQINTSLNIRLKVTRQDRKECNEDGIYTTNKNIMLIRPDKIPYIGRYVAYDENNQPKIVEIISATDPVTTSLDCKITNVVGISTCNIIPSNTLQSGGSAFEFAIGTSATFADWPNLNCWIRRGRGYLDAQNRNKLVLQYSLESVHYNSGIPYFPFTIKTLIAYRIP